MFILLLRCRRQASRAQSEAAVLIGVQRLRGVSGTDGDGLASRSCLEAGPLDDPHRFPSLWTQGSSARRRFRGAWRGQRAASAVQLRDSDVEGESIKMPIGTVNRGKEANPSVMTTGVQSRRRWQCCRAAPPQPFRPPKGRGPGRIREPTFLRWLDRVWRIRPVSMSGHR